MVDRTIPAGKTWREVIGEALKNARSVIVAWSKTSVKSSWVQEEADWGREQKILIPIFIDNVRPPLGFGAVQAADLTDWETITSHAGFLSLLKAISEIVGSPSNSRIGQTETVQEERRIDAVAPSNALVGQSINVFVQVRFPDSEYLSIKDWPFKNKPSLIEQASKSTKVRFSKNFKGELSPAYLRFKVVAPEFKVEGETEKMVEVSPKIFSELISFQLIPKFPGVHGIMINVCDENGVSVGELPVETDVYGEEKPSVKEANIVVLTLKVLVNLEQAESLEQVARKAGVKRKLEETEPKLDETIMLNPYERKPDPQAPTERGLSPPIPPKFRQSTNALRFGVVAGLIVLLMSGIWWYHSESETKKQSTGEQTDNPKPTVERPKIITPEPISPQNMITNSIGMKFVLIPAGSFTMGSPSDEPERGTSERQHEVIISKPFYLQTTEVSQGQWKKVMGNNPSNFKNCGEDCPVEQVSWDMAQQFISKLNQMEDTNKYRLPTEAEWEYACRAGTETPYSIGEVDKLGEYAWYTINSANQAHPIGKKKPNDWGLYDMHGNVWEWVQDWLGEYPSNSVVDPKGPPDKGRGRVLRGGSWRSDARFLRSANRDGLLPRVRDGRFGFRVARDF